MRSFVLNVQAEFHSDPKKRRRIAELQVCCYQCVCPTVIVWLLPPAERDQLIKSNRFFHSSHKLTKPFLGIITLLIKPERGADQLLLVFPPAGSFQRHHDLTTRGHLQL